MATIASSPYEIFRFVTGRCFLFSSMDGISLECQQFLIKYYFSYIYISFLLLPFPYLTSVHTCDEYELHKLFPFSRSPWPITFLQFAPHSPSSTSRLSPLHITHSTLSSSECCGAMKSKKKIVKINIFNQRQWIRERCVCEEWERGMTRFRNVDTHENTLLARKGFGTCLNVGYGVVRAEKSGHQSKYRALVCEHFATVQSFSPRIYTISNFPIFTYLSFIDFAVNTRWINDDIHQVDGVRAPSPTPKKWLNTPVQVRKYAVECQIWAGQECQLDVGRSNQTSNVCRQVVIPTWFEQVAEHPSRRHSTFDKFVTSLRKFVDCCWHICHKRGSRERESVNRTIAFSRVLLWHQHFVRRLDVLSKYTRQSSIFNYWIDGWKINNIYFR